MQSLPWDPGLPDSRTCKPAWTLGCSRSCPRDRMWISCCNSCGFSAFISRSLNSWLLSEQEDSAALSEISSENPEIRNSQHSEKPCPLFWPCSGSEIPHLRVAAHNDRLPGTPSALCSLQHLQENMIRATARKNKINNIMNFNEPFQYWLQMQNSAAIHWPLECFQSPPLATFNWAMSHYATATNVEFKPLSSGSR